jgi:hypothetical protein
MKTKKLCSQIENLISQMLIKFAKCEHLLKWYTMTLRDLHQFQPTLGFVVFVFSETQLKCSTKAIM